MSNDIRYAARPDLPSVQMNNGLTSVVVAVLCLGASELADTDGRRELAAWIGSRDQGVFGVGMVGFDLETMPWHRATFEDERAFVLAAIEAAKAKTGWDRLRYPPNEEWVVASLERLRTLVVALELADVREPVWFGNEPPASWEKCSKHAVYQHAYGCAICNDE